jgi:hypothetical protein
LTHPIVTGDRLGLALPEPPAYCAKFVTEPAAATAGAELAVAGAELAGAELAAEDAGVELELECELEPELQAATPATRQAATAIARHPEPALIGRRIPVKRTIAPFRLSADYSPARSPN